jgi:hypothetical protein
MTTSIAILAKAPVEDDLARMERELPALTL